MKWDMDVLPRDADLLRREAAQMPQDEAFPEFVAAVVARGALVEVVSDGLGFYIESNLAALGVSGRLRGHQRQPRRERRRGHVVPIQPPDLLRMWHVQARAGSSPPGGGSGCRVHR